LYKQYGKETIRLSRCAACHNIGDRYVELEFNVKLLDLIMHKQPVYRHFIFNNIPHYEKGINPALAKLLVIYFVLDVYMTVFQFQSSLTTALLFVAMDYMMYVTILIIVLRLLLGQESSLPPNYVVMAMIISSFGKFILGIMIVFNYPVDFTVLISVFVFTSNIVAILAALPRANSFFVKYFQIFSNIQIIQKKK